MANDDRIKISEVISAHTNGIQVDIRKFPEV